MTSNQPTSLRRSRRNTLVTMTLAAACVGATGCTGFGQKTDMGRPSTAKTQMKDESIWDKMPWAGKQNQVPDPYPTPAKLAATWSPDTLMQSGRTPTRGFGGRLFFFDEKSHAVPVDGTLVVHGFDERAVNEADRVKRYEFTPEQFTRHYSQSDLGASYSVWIPWDAIGGKQQEISLVASFVTVEGKSVQSAPAKVLLPGEVTDKQETLAQRYSPQFRDWKLAQSSNRMPVSGLSTTTIARKSRSTRSRDDEGSELNRTMMAIGDATPSGEIQMKSQPRRKPMILPASATLPSKR